MPSHVAYEIKALFNEEKPIIEISYSHDVEFDQDAFQEVYLFLSNITERRYKNINSFFEIYYNAKNNHINSLKTLAKIRRDAFTFSDDQHLYDPSFIERNANKQNEWQEIINHFNEQELKQNTLDRITVENHRNLLSRLDNLTLDEQLLNLVATNNRQAVYDLINSYLPWTELSPFEWYSGKSIWTLSLILCQKKSAFFFINQFNQNTSALPNFQNLKITLF